MNNTYFGLKPGFKVKHTNDSFILEHLLNKGLKILAWSQIELELKCIIIILNYR